MRNPKSFKIYIGIDQTGAIKTPQQAKPLNICIWVPDQKKMFIEPIETLNQANLKQVLNKNGLKWIPEKIVIVVDAVLGLPQECLNENKNIFDYLMATKSYQHNGHEFGLKCAASFFAAINPYKNKSIFPRREIEIKLNANSVFKEKPYQRNIGCGTFRIWKDLASDPSWWNLYPYSKPNKKGVIIFEGYPSYYFKKLFGIKNRNVQTLGSKLPAQYQRHFQKVLKFNDVNIVDSFVLAISAEIILRTMKNSIKPLNHQEGFILGFE